MIFKSWISLIKGFSWCYLTHPPPCSEQNFCQCSYTINVLMKGSHMMTKNGSELYPMPDLRKEELDPASVCFANVLRSCRIFLPVPYSVETTPSRKKEITSWFWCFMNQKDSSFCQKLHPQNWRNFYDTSMKTLWWTCHCQELWY